MWGEIRTERINGRREEEDKRRAGKRHGEAYWVDKEEGERSHERRGEEQKDDREERKGSR